MLASGGWSENWDLPAHSIAELDSDDSKAEAAPRKVEAQDVLDTDAPTASDAPWSSPVHEV